MRLPRDYIKTPVGMHRNGGRLASGMPVGIPPESRSASERNAGRHGPDSAVVSDSATKPVYACPDMTFLVLAISEDI